MPWRHEKQDVRPVRSFERVEAKNVKVGDRIALTKHGYPRTVLRINEDPDKKLVEIFLVGGGVVRPRWTMILLRRTNHDVSS